MTAERPDEIRLELPATYRYLSIVSACIGELLQHIEHIANREQVLYSIQLAAHETCTNLIDHAYAGNSNGLLAITLMLSYDTRQIIIEIRDTGVSFDPDCAPPINLDQPQEHGYGLFLIRNLMDEVSYTSTADGNCWRLVKRL